MPTHVIDESVDRIPLMFNTRISWLVLLSISFLGSLLYFFIYVQKYDGDEGFLKYDSVIENLKLLFTYFVPFECITIFILLLLISVYHKILNINFVILNIKGLIYYELIMLPLFVSSIFIFAPITNSIRYTFYYYPRIGWKNYYPEHFFTVRMYFNYLIPILAIGYSYVNVNIFINYVKRKNDQLISLSNQLSSSAKYETTASVKTTTDSHSINAFDKDGQTELSFRRVLFFEIENKQYLAYTNNETYTIRQKLAELETILPAEQFYRINRSVIINFAYFKSYSYWENDKYIIRMTDEKTTFVMQRARLEEFRKRLKAYQGVDSQADNRSEATL